MTQHRQKPTCAFCGALLKWETDESSIATDHHLVSFWTCTKCGAGAEFWSKEVTE